MKSTLKLVKTISFDVSKIYKNFIHWNISKVIISLATIALGFVFALPFMIILIIMYFVFDLSVYIDSIQVNMLSLYTFAGQMPVVFTLFMIFILLAWLTMLFWYSYKKVLLTRLNLDYIDGNKMSYFAKENYDYKLISKYIGVISWVSLFVAIPVLVFLVIFFILFFAFWWSEWVQTLVASSRFNPFTVSTFILFIVCLLAFIYISYRLFFSVIMLSDSKNFDNDKKAIFYLKESAKVTKWINTIMRFILVIIISSIVILPLWTLGDYFSNSLKDVRLYKEYLNLDETQKKVVDDNWSSSYYINRLKLDYWNTSEADLNSMENAYFYLTYLFIIINYLIIFWLFEMAIVSFYRHELLKKKSIIDTIISKI